MSPTAQILAVAAITAGSCGAIAAAMTITHHWREHHRRGGRVLGTPDIPAAPDNVRGTDAEAFGTCRDIAAAGTAKRRNTREAR